MVPQHVGCSSIASHSSPLLFGICQLRCADCVRDGASYTFTSTAASTSINARGVTGALGAGWSSLMGTMGHRFTVADLQSEQKTVRHVEKIVKKKSKIKGVPVVCTVLD